MLKKVKDWVRIDHRIQKHFYFENFVESIAFVNAVAAIAEAEDHHPDITISWNQVILSLTTHSVNGLSKNDFILAAKIDQLAIS
jgi:4a-hydroxytetrahydrobiopterin dehydratase